VLTGVALVLAGAFAGVAALGALPDHVWAFVGLFALAGAAYALAVAAVVRRPPSGGRALVAILGAAVLFRLILLPTVPSLSTDVYRYLWDGRVQAAGLSPYTEPPNSPTLASLRDPVIYPRLNHLDWRTIYPPGAQLVFALLASLAPSSVLAFKSLVVAADLATALVLSAWLGALGRPQAWVLIYAWHPLVVIELAGSGHLDALALLASVAALWAATRGREAWAGIWIGLGALVKLYPLLLLPALGGRRASRVVGACAIVVAAGYLCYARAGWAVVGSLPRFVAHEQFNGTLRTLLEWVVVPLGGPGRVAARLIPLLALSGLAVGLAWRGRTIPPWQRAAWLVGAYCLTTPSLFPWYVLWLVPLLAVELRWPWLWLTGAVALTYLVFAEPLWRMPPWVPAVEFIPLAAGLAWTPAGRLYGKRDDAALEAVG